MFNLHRSKCEEGFRFGSRREEDCYCGLIYGLGVNSGCDSLEPVVTSRMFTVSRTLRKHLPPHSLFGWKI
jgi:hypothetical protein